MWRHRATDSIEVSYQLQPSQYTGEVQRYLVTVTVDDDAFHRLTVDVPESRIEELVGKWLQHEGYLELKSLQYGAIESLSAYCRRNGIQLTMVDNTEMYEEVMMYRRNPVGAVSKKRYQLRVATLDQMMSVGTIFYVHQLPVVKEGTLEQLQKYADVRGLRWRTDRYMLFGGYWIDPEDKMTYYMT